MTILWYTCYEGCNLAEFDSTDINPDPGAIAACQAVLKHHGSYAGHYYTPVGHANYAANWKTFAPELSDVWVVGAVRFHKLPNINTFLTRWLTIAGLAGKEMQCGVVNVGGVAFRWYFRAYIAGGWSTNTAADGPALDTWYYFCARKDRTNGVLNYSIGTTVGDAVVKCSLAGAIDWDANGMANGIPYQGGGGFESEVYMDCLGYGDAGCFADPCIPTGGGRAPASVAAMASMLIQRMKRQDKVLDKIQDKRHWAIGTAAQIISFGGVN